MTITNGYCTLAEIKDPSRLDSSAVGSDATLESVIEAVSRAIDYECSRFFWKDTNDATYYFTAKDTGYILIGDFVSITSLSVDFSGTRNYTTWTLTTDYDLYPYNYSADGLPIAMIELAPHTGKSFGVDIGKGVKIVGKRGWPAVPKPIKEACLIWSERIFQRGKTPLGISGMTAIGEMNMRVPPPDPDVFALLAPYKLNYFG